MARAEPGRPERSFTVHAAEDAPSRGLRVTAAGFEDAALTFVEAWHAEGAEVALMVEDSETGERRCFRIDLDTGETAPCD